MPQTTGSLYFAEALKAKGISHVFIVPTILTPSLAHLDRMGVRVVTAHSEKAAAYMADGYGRASGRPGICAAQTIGASNLAAGLRDAKLACAPLIAITGGPVPETRHRHVYQEIDDFPLFEPLCKSNAQIDGVSRLPDLLRQAFRDATSGCPGPVHLQIAGHFGQAIDVEAELDACYEPQFAKVPAVRPRAEDHRVREAAQVLQSARRPVLVAGGGVRSSGAHAEVVQLAQKLSIPVATSLNAKGTVREDHDLSVGVVGWYSRSCANRIVTEADLVFFIGSHTGGQVTNRYQVPRPGARVMQLDIDASELGRNYANVCSVCGDAKLVLQQLIEVAAEGRPDEAWLAHVRDTVGAWRANSEPLLRSDAVPIRPERLCADLQSCLPEDAVLVSDTGHSGMWTGIYVELNQPDQQYLRAAGSLGWALPASIGIKCALPDRPVVCFTGDGGFYYHMAELETALRYDIPIVVVVNDNHALNQETQIFKDAWGGEQRTGLEMWQFRDLDLAKVAQSMGWRAQRVEKPGDIRPALAEALACGGPALVDVATDIEALAPDPVK